MTRKMGFGSNHKMFYGACLSEYGSLYSISVGTQNLKALLDKHSEKHIYPQINEKA